MSSVPPMTPPPPAPPAPPPPPSQPEQKVLLGVPLVPDVHQWRKWWSLRWMIAATIAETVLQTWPRMPPEWIGPMPTWLSAALGIFVMIALPAAAVSRFMRQQSK